MKKGEGGRVFIRLSLSFRMTLQPDPHRESSTDLHPTLVGLIKPLNKRARESLSDGRTIKPLHADRSLLNSNEVPGVRFATGSRRSRRSRLYHHGAVTRNGVARSRFKTLSNMQMARKKQIYLAARETIHCHSRPPHQLAGRISRQIKRMVGNDDSRHIFFYGIQSRTTCFHLLLINAPTFVYQRPRGVDPQDSYLVVLVKRF